jgi:two-component system, NtrC family, sensor histidine kinase PilS
MASPSQQRMHKMIEDNSVRINRIIEDILAISRRERPSGDAIDLATFFADFLPEFVAQQGCASDAIEVQLLALEPMQFDSAHLHQILVNLLSNALRYCSKNKASVLVVWQKSRLANVLELIIADDGPGVPAQIMPNLFEPFSTTEHKGTGLGLYLARELCEINAASLRYEPDVRRALDSRLSPNWPAKGAFVIAVAVT